MENKEDVKRSVELVLEKWIASLASKDRSNKSVPGNFDELFEKLSKTDATFEYVHDDILPKAIKAHLPNAGLARAVYKRCKDFTEHSEKEFIDSWHKSINDAATESFYSFFKLKAEEDQPKRYGNLSLRDHRQQQRYVESFETLDINEIEARIQEIANMDVQEILNVLGHTDGESNSGSN